MSESTSVTSFQAAEVGARINTNLEAIIQLLDSPASDDLREIKERLLRDLQEHRQREMLTVAFVGQYNAGKSTMISALTNRRDIKIHSDIATGETATFDWNGIRVIDTPGIFTDRHDHDAITYDAIKRADLLVFCLTYSLFDTITADNFKKLAFELGYRRKMMLVINKMSDEAGDEDEKIKNYRKSIAVALAPHEADEFATCFIDAREFVEGVDDGDFELQKWSRFSTFVQTLNEFVADRGALARLDTPIRILLGALDEISSIVARNGHQDNAYLELLNRLSRSVRNERSRLRNKCRGELLSLSGAVAEEGVALSQSIGDGDRFTVLSARCESNVRSLCLSTGERLEAIVEESSVSLQEDVAKVLNSPLASAFTARLSAYSAGAQAQNPVLGQQVSNLRDQVDSLQKVKVASSRLTKLATGARGEATGSGGFLSATGAAGSVLHEGVKTVGHVFGVKFRPWEAVNMAKNLGNIAKVVGPLLSVATLVMDLMSVAQEDESARKVADARRDVMSQFSSMGRDLELQYEEQLRLAEGELFGDVERRIAEARHAEEAEIAKSNSDVAEITRIRGDLQALLTEIGGPVKV